MEFAGGPSATPLSEGKSYAEPVADHYGLVGKSLVGD